jgi:hypothetical protein
MSDPGKTVFKVTAGLEQVLRNMQSSLRGECAFAGDDVKALQELLAQMDPVIAQSAELRLTQPELSTQLDLYKAKLLELQKTVEQLRVTLLVQRAGVEAKRAQLSAASEWCEAFHRTR